jgi:hypothetical protein
MRRRIIAGVIVATGLATAGIAYADNQSADPSVAITRAAATGAAAPAAATGAAAPAAAGGKGGVLRGAIHGDLLVRSQDGSTRTVTFDRGKIGAVSGSAITIERADGVSVSKDVTDQTVFNGLPRDQLTSGTPVLVVSEGPAATHVVSKGARAEAKAKACADQPAAGADPGVRGRLKERACQRFEKRQERREQRQEKRQERRERRADEGSTAGAGDGGVTSEQPAGGPASVVDDGLETILS